jgi:hypothetical protein
MLTTGKPWNIHTWQPIAATSGTDTACTNGTGYVGSILIPAACTITGIGYLVGSVGGTNSVVVSLHDSAGTLLANSAAAGTLVGTAAQVQQVAFTTPYVVDGNFTVKDWKDYPDTTTPLSQAAMEDLETRVTDYTDAKGMFAFIAVTFNGTTAKFRTVPAHCQAGVIGNGVTQTFGTPASFTAPTTFTADKVPVAFVY